MSELRGRDYVAVRALYTRDGLVAAVGERCDRVPVQSLAGLLERDKIAPAPKADKKASAQ